MKTLMTTFLALTILSSAAQATEKMNLVCIVLDSSIPGLYSAKVEGPVSDRAFRVRLLDNSGKQIDTGACEQTGECYTKDWTGYHDTLSALRVKLSPTAEENSLYAHVSSKAGKAVLLCVRK